MSFMSGPGVMTQPYGYDPGITVPQLPWVGGATPTPPMSPSQSTADNQGYYQGEYISGPFCFGLDKLICQSLPPTIRLGSDPRAVYPFGIDIPVRAFCGSLANLTCAVLVLLALLVLLSIGIVGLLNPFS